MGFLDSILGGGNNASQAPPPSVDQQHSMLQSVLAMIQSSKLGGLQGLIQRFQNAGLGHLMSGWISSGPNPPNDHRRVSGFQRCGRKSFGS